jgi:hypothetical protein
VFDVVVIDGEVIVPTKTGRSDFGALESDVAVGRSDGTANAVVSELSDHEPLIALATGGSHNGQKRTQEP